MTARFPLLAALCALTVATSATAQLSPSRPLMRGDVNGSVGWAHVNEDDASQWDRWDHGVGHAGAAFGWYWSDHLKTEVAVDTVSTATFYRFEHPGGPGSPASRGSTIDVRGTSVGVLQHYQFLRNAWVHPFLAAGVEFHRESRVVRLDPAAVFDPVTRQYVEIAPAQRIEEPASWLARGVIAGGVKAYVSPRIFTRFDTKVAVRDGVDAVSLRFGLGVDF
jgi:hypothetical protein